MFLENDVKRAPYNSVYYSKTMTEFDLTNSLGNAYVCQIYDTYIHNDSGDQYRDYAVLKLYVNSDNAELVELYSSHIKKHNVDLSKTNYPNSGFDLFIPDTVSFRETAPFATKMVDLQIKAEMFSVNLTTRVIAKMTEANTESEEVVGFSHNTGYYLFPRSSISKTPLMLANHTGIIDSGYRGKLMTAIRSFSAEYEIEKHTRLFQICHPSLCPVYVVLVNESDLAITERGEGGFGSTGIKGTLA